MLKKIALLFLLTLFSSVTYAQAGINTGLTPNSPSKGPFPIGFEFEYFGKKYTEFYPQYGGYLNFTDHENEDNEDYSSLHVFKYEPGGSDLEDYSIPSAVFYKTEGVAPNRTLTVQWTNINYEENYGDSNHIRPVGTFQAVIYEGSNVVEYKYYSADSDIFSELIWGVNLIAPDSDQVNYNPRDIQPEQYSFKFKPVDKFIDCDGDYEDEEELIGCGIYYTVEKNTPFEFLNISDLDINIVLRKQRYMNAALEWHWNAISGVNKYEVEVYEAWRDDVITKDIVSGTTFKYTGAEEDTNYKIRVRGTRDNGATWLPWSLLSNPILLDLKKPEVYVNQLYYKEQSNALLSAGAYDEGYAGVGELCGKIANSKGKDVTEVICAVTDDYGYLMDLDAEFKNLPQEKGLYGLVRATDKAGNTTGWTKHEIELKPPYDLVSDAEITKEGLEVTGVSDVPGQVQLYLDGKKIGGLVSTDEEGRFVTRIKPEEGQYELTADITTHYGTSKQSEPQPFLAEYPNSKPRFITPAEGSLLERAKYTIELDANYIELVDSIELTDGRDTVLATFTEPPFTYVWRLKNEDNGYRTLTARATNVFGKVATDELKLTVDVKLPPPMPIPTSKTRFTNTAPEWTWGQLKSLIGYEIELQDDKQNSLHTAVVGDVGVYQYKEGVTHGATYKARVRGSIDEGETWDIWSELSGEVTIDTIAPTYRVNSFYYMGNNKAQLDITTTDDLSGIKQSCVKIVDSQGVTANEPQCFTSNRTVTINHVPEQVGAHALLQVQDNAGNATEWTRIDLTSKAPVITTPAANAVLYENAVKVSGKSEAAGDVQLYLDNSKIGSVVKTTATGEFETTVTLDKEGNFNLAADITTPFGTSTLSSSVPFTIKYPIPVVDFTAPASGAVLVASPTKITANVTDVVAIDQVEFLLDSSTSLAVVKQPPYEYNWVITQADNGRHTLTVKATNSFGKTTAVDRPITVNIQPPKPKPGPKVKSRFTNEAPQWNWNKTAAANAYQLEVQDSQGAVIHTATLGDVDIYTYAAGQVHGVNYRARLRTSTDNGATWGAWTELSTVTTVDTAKPTYAVDSFFYAGNKQAKLTVQVADDLSGVKNYCIKVATPAVVPNEANCFTTERTVTLNNVSETAGTYGLIQVQDNAGNTTDWSRIELALLSPVISSPVANTMIAEKTLNVVGNAGTVGNVQLYVNDVKHGSLIKTDNKGEFKSTITFEAEGRYIVTADVTTTMGTSAKSTVVPVTVKYPVPIVNFVTPSQGVTLSTESNKIIVSAIDAEAISKVEIVLDDKTTLTTLTQPPYEYNWAVTMADNGPHKLTAKVTNSLGKITIVDRAVKVDVLPPPPEPAPYTGKILSVTPAVSYGPQPIVIKGQGVSTSNTETIKNSPLNLVLMVNGFKRTVEVFTDAQGQFEYTFTPQESDSGVYRLSVLHPNQNDFVEQGSFTIDRIAFDYQGYNLTAVRGVETAFTVHTTASAGAEGLRWVMRAEDQPEGKLPEGISVDNGAGIKVAANKSTPMRISLTGNNQATKQGTVMLVALASNSGDMVRGKLQLNYQLAEAMPQLTVKPSSIKTGLSQNQSIVEQFTLTNAGFTTANNVQVQLLDAQGNAAAPWVFISNNSKVGAVDVGQSVSIQITANPNTSIANGVYNFIARVTADNGQGGDVPVAISVTQNGKGSVVFDVADIYTSRLDENGQPILGVKNATIKLQNDAVVTEQYSLTTNDKGIATLDDIPAGIYRYRASAADHMDTSGRIMVRPNGVANEHVFLEYELINIEFGVTETTIQDVYDIVLDLTFKTDVPAPVVLLEPLSINLAGLQEGEVKTGQLTLSNYGLVQADNVVFTAPTSNAEYKYEFFGEIPDVLPPKTRIVIPYKITALKPSAQPQQVMRLSAPVNTNRAGPNCSSYYASFNVQYQSECANGDISKGSNAGNFYRVSGTSCSGSSGSGWGGGGWSGGGSGGWGGGNIGVSPIPMSSGCIPVCDGSCAVTGGFGAGN
ncbi:Ig-like domain-containing protein [Pseudomonas sp. F1_0610]|uniref:Ig-like domain-containing protein n=1 Tax=Pseudomonas sp. F1_0610 TaxID=3114284 RepID=UPI0039C39935